MPATKIATCCYCGSRTALRLRGKERHELTCANCAAPLHNMKMFPVAPASAATAPATTPVRPARPDGKSRKPPPRRPSRNRKVGRFARKIWEEIWDELEDIFD